MSEQVPHYQFFALVREGRQKAIRRIRISQELQTGLTERFLRQAAELLDEDVERVEFDPNFHPKEEHVFAIDGFELPEDFRNAARHPAQFEDFNLSSLSQKASVKSVFAAYHTPGTERDTLYFQAFRASRRLRKGWSLFQTGRTFHTVEEEGFTIDTKLVAAYDDGSLYFRSHSSVNPILDLTEYYKAATDEDISAALAHDLLHVEDAAAIVAMADQTMRKRFTAILTSGVLDKVSARKVQSRGKKFDLEVSVTNQNGKQAIRFPTEKGTVKRLLQHLNQGFYMGELTGEPFETNSHRSMKKQK